MRVKQLLLTGFVVLTFIAYSLQQKHNSAGVTLAPAVSNKSSQNQSTPSSNSSQTSSSSGTGSSAGTNSGTSTQTTSGFKDGAYTGTVADAYYGNIQVQATISGGKITDVKFLQAPSDQNTSVRINQQADPWLAQEAIKAQSSQVDIISGATDSSQAFIQSLSSALQKAQQG